MIATNDELREELLRSKSFVKWSPSPNPSEPPTISVGRSFTYKGRTYKNLAVDERHYTPADLAKAWVVSAETIRVLFRDEPGVLKIGKDGTRLKRGYKTLRIPESIAQRVHTRLSA